MTAMAYSVEEAKSESCDSLELFTVNEAANF